MHENNRQVQSRKVAILLTPLATVSVDIYFQTNSGPEVIKSSGSAQFKMQFKMLISKNSQ